MESAMKRADALKKIREAENEVQTDFRKKIMQLEAEMELENRISNRSRARSIAVGTAFGGTTEITMRSDGGKFLWCLMQPVEVIELINQLAANVGCNIDLKPRDDFASWRDWRVSEAEKKHLNNHAPFVNDMAVFQKLGASGYNDEEVKKIMNVLANAKEFANEDRDDKLKDHTNIDVDGKDNLMVSDEPHSDGLVVNKLLQDEDGNVLYMAGGNGGIDIGVEDEKVAIKKTVNRRSSK